MFNYRYLLIFIFFIASFSGCAQVTIVSVEKLNLPAAGGFYHPKLDKTGNLLLLTGENYQGLHLFNLKTGELKHITDADGAGYSPQISGDGETVLFAANEFIQNRLHTKLMAWYKPTGIADQVAPPARELTTLYRRGDEVLFKSNGLLKSARIGQEPAPAGNSPAAGIEDRKLVVYMNGEAKAIDPLQCESYIWPSVSAEGKTILAYGMGKGAFICDTNGKLIKELGNIEAPVWAVKDFIAGMVTKDDGHQIISSEIILLNVKTGKRQTISPSGTVAMYPSGASGAEKIAFQSSKGEIYLLSYRITP